jgi:hypothetical protein
MLAVKYTQCIIWTHHRRDMGIWPTTTTNSHNHGVFFKILFCSFFLLFFFPPTAHSLGPSGVIEVEVTYADDDGGDDDDDDDDDDHHVDKTVTITYGSGDEDDHAPKE